MTHAKRNVLGIAIWLVVIGLVIFLAERVLPAYTNQYTACSVCEDPLADPTIDSEDVDAVRT